MIILQKKTSKTTVTSSFLSRDTNISPFKSPFKSCNRKIMQIIWLNYVNNLICIYANMQINPFIALFQTIEGKFLYHSGIAWDIWKKCIKKKTNLLKIVKYNIRCQNAWETKFNTYLFQSLHGTSICIITYLMECCLATIDKYIFCFISF